MVDFNIIFKGGSSEIEGGGFGVNNVLALVALTIGLFSAEIMRTGLPAQIAVDATNEYLQKHMDQKFTPIVDAIAFHSTDIIQNEISQGTYVLDNTNFNKSFLVGELTWEGVDFMDPETQLMSKVVKYGQNQTKASWNAQFVSREGDVIPITTKSQYDTIFDNVIRNVGRIRLTSLFKNVGYRFQNDGKVVQLEFYLPDNSGNLIITRDTNLPTTQYVVDILNQAAVKSKKFQDLIMGDIVPPTQLVPIRQTTAQDTIILPTSLNPSLIDTVFKAVGSAWAGISMADKVYKMYQKSILTEMYNNLRNYYKTFKGQIKQLRQVATLEDIARRTPSYFPPPSTTVATVTEPATDTSGTGLFSQVPPAVTVEQQQREEEEEEVPNISSPLIQQPFHLLKKRRSSKRKVSRKKSRSKKRKSSRRKSKSPRRKSKSPRRSPAVKAVHQARKLLKSSPRRSRSRSRSPKKLSEKSAFIKAARELAKKI